MLREWTAPLSFPNVAESTAKKNRFRPSDRVVGRRDDQDPVIRLEIYGIFILAFSVALFLALVTFDPADVSATGGTRTQPAVNAVGPIGAHVADLFLGAVGLGAFAFTGTFGFLGLSYLIGRRSHLTKLDVLGWFGLILGGTVMLHVMLPGELLGHSPGGLSGEYVGEILRAFLSTPGTILLSLTIVVVSTIALTRRSIFELGVLLGRLGRATGRGIVKLIRQGERDEDEEEGFFEDEADPEEAAPEPEKPAKKREKKDEEAKATPESEPEPEAEPEPESKAVAEAEAEPERAAEPKAKPEPEPEPEEDVKIVESAAMRRARDLVVGEQISLMDEGEEGEKAYELPSLSFLDYRPPKSTSYDRDFLKKNAQLLEQKLADYRVKGKVVEIHPGPVITMYEFQPAPGVKISSIANLADDLAMALSALRIRIVAPIPGKNVVGIEVPNKAREIVWLKEILSDTSYSKAKSKLTLGLGKDIVGNPTCMNLAKAPHLLVAGATGAGKSVAINSFIVSLLYSSTPEDVRLIMVDPKMLELSIYEGIPHLLLPVVTDPKQAAVALRWAVKEMERRYRLMADMGVRNMANYNSRVEGLLANPAAELPARLELARKKRVAKGDEEPDANLRLDCAGEPLEKLPYIVVLIDELADLMMVASKEVEHSIARLAQMARASGIHLILATQRPSVDVITGLIKANFPTRISFQVASKVDSRTILDQKGAENLLGMGDMLWLPPGSSSVKRVHGAYVSEDEIHKIVAHLKEQGTPDYNLAILTHDDDEEESGGSNREDLDPLYDQALRIVAETRNASISFLQRKLKIGYNRSARIVEQLEEEGIVGPSDGTSRPREVFIDPI